MCSVCGCSHTEDHHHVAGQGDFHHHHPFELLRVEQDILAKNDFYARENRLHLNAKGVFAVNLISSPGSGKTTLLTKTVDVLKARLPVAVIEGDQQTSIDAERIRKIGVPAIQINTGRGCHLDAHMVGHALGELVLQRGGILFIENVGNLVCPAGFDLGEANKTVILSVTEGDDKPLKYPDAFAASRMMVISKIDLLPYVDFDVDRCIDHAKAINPEIAVLQLSARSDEGMTKWLDWLTSSAQNAGNLASNDAYSHA
jgi:hydrogenase nickel incorporation protein HypB